MSTRTAFIWIALAVLTAITAIFWDSPSETDAYARDQLSLSDARVSARLSANYSKDRK